MVHPVETLVIGAGLIGSSVAMSLAKLGSSAPGEIRVIDFDLEGSLSSSELNAGGVRATWVQPVNIRASQLSIDYFASVADEVGYRACGYLWLRTKEQLAYSLKARELQTSMGWPVEVLDVTELRRRVPFIDKTDDLAGAVFAPRDGLVNPNLLKNHFRSEARARGVIFDDRTLLAETRPGPDGQGVILVCDRFDRMLTLDERREVLSGQSVTVPRTRVEYHARRVVNCAGPWAAPVARILGYESPAKAVRRQVCIFDCREVDLTPYGMIVDTSGVYFHPEATNGLCGIATDEPEGVNYHYDGEDFFMEKIWPALYERSSGFEKLRHLTGWAGLYEVSPDESAIIGQAVVAGRASDRIFEAHSFSGHGAMHSYAAGLGLAELILTNRYQTMDFTELSAARFASGKFIKETAVI